MAQENVHDRALAEVRAGRKQSHWMWFVYPQLRGLGSSDISWHYGLSGLEEARAYLDHPVVGPRLREATEAALSVPPERSAEDVFGAIDALKLRSSMTLFRRAAPDDPRFLAVLERFFGGQPDPATLRLLETRAG